MNCTYFASKPIIFSTVAPGEIIDNYCTWVAKVIMFTVEMGMNN